MNLIERRSVLGGGGFAAFGPGAEVAECDVGEESEL